MYIQRKIALIDWDGTIRDGYTIKEWIKFLIKNSNKKDDLILETINKMFIDYQKGILSHDQLADITAQIYADYLNGLDTTYINHLAKEFLSQDEKRLFSYSIKLFELLHNLKIQTVVISGCPSVILDLYKEMQKQGVRL